MGNAKTKLKLLLTLVSDMIADAYDCQTELKHIKAHHNQDSVRDLTASFIMAERQRHLEHIERRIGGCLDKLQKHQKQVINLLET